MSQTYDLTSSSIYGHYIQIEGKGTLTGHASVTSWDVTPDGGLRFVGNPSQIELEMFLWGTGVHFYIDGVDQGLLTTATGSVYGFQVIATGLDTTQNHTYEIAWGKSNNAFIFKTLRTPGADIVTTDLAARKVLAGYGDSITLGKTKSDGDSCTSFLKKVGVSLNYQVVNRGHSSSAVSNSFSGTDAGETRTADITALSPKPDICVVLYGINDAINLVDITAFGTSESTMLTALASGSTGTRYIVERLLKHGSSTTDQDAYSTKISDAVTALANAKVVYKTGMYAAYNGVSGLHPQLADQAAIITAVLADVATPSSGVGSKGLISLWRRNHARS